MAVFMALAIVFLFTALIERTWHRAVEKFLACITFSVWAVGLSIYLF